MYRALFLLLTTATLADDRVIIDHGRSDYEIVQAAEANPATTFAARELNTWIKQSTGIELPVVTTPSPERKHVFVGPGASSIGADGLKPEGYRLKTVGADIHIVGVDVQRGSLQPKRAACMKSGKVTITSCHR